MVAYALRGSSIGGCFASEDFRIAPLPADGKEVGRGRTAAYTTCVVTQLHANAFKRAQVLLTRFFQSGLDIKTPFVILFFEQIFQSMYMFYAREVFLTLQILTKEDRQTTGLEKGVLTATVRVGGHWQMRVIWAGFH